jgi:TetR/AcrR family transcriptional repressor of nem operon
VNVNGTRAQIVATSADLIWRHGYHRASVDDIIKAVGVSKGTFYHHFSSKEALGLAVIDSWVDHFSASIRAHLSETNAPLENLHGILDGIVRAQQEAGYLGCPLGRLALEMGDVSERLRKRLEDGFEGLRSLFAEHLELGGMAPAQAAQVGRYMLATLEGSLMLDKVRGGGMILDGLIDAMKSDINDRLVAISA